MSAHGFRAMARTVLAEQLKIPKDLLERQLSHRAPDDDLNGAYDRAKFLDDRKRMMGLWANYLDGLKYGAEIIPLRAAG